ncbi:Rpn family recombination-promoting nuclease/putative transposase [Cardinium endosymbiont of Philonthus spinipes]|uniref:Rpn family recombination-promoting nuclease/putative transposase n=1 Tax=Cardinium endosymbiont of Philonthus spinipes TaxID=3077941 RepID=UPI00313E7DE5
MTKKKDKKKNNKDAVHQPHDKFFRRTFSKKEVALALLEARLPKTIFNQIDQESFRLANKDFVSDMGKNRDSDCIFQALIKHTKSYIYCVIEHQSEEDSLMLLRFLEYNTLLMRQHITEYGTASLPAIINICLYNGNKPYKGLTNLHKLFPTLDPVKDYMFQGFHLVDLNITADDELLSWKEAAGATMILKQGIYRDFCEWLPDHQELLLDLEKKGYIPYISDIIWYILSIDDHTNALELMHPKLKEIAMSVAERLRQEGEKMGLEKGMRLGEEKGKLEEKRGIAKMMLESGESIDKIIRFTGLSSSQIQDLV